MQHSNRSVTKRRKSANQVHEIGKAVPAPKKKKKNKFGAKKVTIDGIKFDSITESEYYKLLKQQGKKFELQPEFVLLDGYINKSGKKVKPIKYKSDFLIYEPDGSFYIVDIKGKATEAAKMKRKMFEARYKDISLLWIVFVQKRGGWLLYDDNEKMIKEEKRKKEAAKKGDGLK